MNKKSDKKTYALSDDVLRRIVQIVQEGMMLGTDVTDLMRDMRLTTSGDMFGVSEMLTLTEEYVVSVRDSHEKLLQKIETLKTEEDARPAPVDDNGSN